MTGCTPQELARIDELMADMKAKYGPGAQRERWQPTEKHPVRVIHERRLYEQKFYSIANQIKLAGGKVKEIL